jgi:hypothetical protein
MMAHRSIVSLGFKVSGLVFGVPAVVGFVLLTAEAIVFRHAAKPDGQHMISVQKYGIAGLLNDAGVGVDRMFGALAGLAAWLFAGLAFAALLFSLWALLLYLVGRGVGRGATWARIVGGVLALGLTLASFLTFTSVPHRWMAAPLPVLALGLYTLWTLIWRFKTPIAPAAKLSE